MLQAAVFTDRRLRLRYRSSGHREPEAERSASVRVMDPYGLVYKAGIWYLVADSGGEPRLFRVPRMVSAVADNEPVRRRAELAAVASEIVELYSNSRLS